MRSRIAAWGLLGLLTVVAWPALSQERKAPAKPTVIIRLKSLDGLISDARYLAELAGKGEEAKQGEGLLKQMAGPKGLAGIDTKKPFGVYGKLGPNGLDSDVVAMIPVADEDAAVELVKRFVKPEKGDDGVYTANVDRVPFPIFFRFHDGYAYVTARDKDVIDKARLLKPADVLPPARIGVVSATINIDEIPETTRKTIIGQAELKAAEDKERRRPGETEVQQRFRAAGSDWAMGVFKQILNEGGPLDVRFNLDRKNPQLILTGSIAGVPGSKLAKEIEGMGKRKSAVSGLVGADSAISMLLHIALPAELKKAYEDLLDETLAKLPGEEKDENKRKVNEMLLKAVAPTLKAGEIDAGINVRGPYDDGKFALVMGAKIQQGAAIEKALKTAYNELPASEKQKGRLNIAKAGGANIHEIKPDNIDEKTKDMLGDGPVYLAIRSNMVVLGGGQNGLESVKEALAAEGKGTAIARFQMSVRRFARILERDNPGSIAAAKEVFEKNPQGDKMGVTLTGGKALTARFTMSAPLVRFFTLVEEAKKKKQEN